MRAANQGAGDKAEQGKNTGARQRKRAMIRERAKTGIQPSRLELGLSPPYQNSPRSLKIYFKKASPQRFHSPFL